MNEHTWTHSLHPKSLRNRSWGACGVPPHCEIKETLAGAPRKFRSHLDTNRQAELSLAFSEQVFNRPDDLLHFGGFAQIRICLELGRDLFAVRVSR